MKHEKRRLKILKDYRDSLLKFVGISLLAALLFLLFFWMIKDNPYNLDPLHLLSIVIVWLVLFFFMLLKCYNKNYLLFIASILIWGYVVSGSEMLINFAFFFLMFSFLHEVVLRFILGVEIRLKTYTLPWNEEIK